MPAILEHDTRVRDGSLWIRIVGDLGTAPHSTVLQEISDRVEEDSHPVTVDLSACRSVHSAAMAALLTWNEASRTRGRPLRLVPPRDPNVLHILRVIGILDLVEVVAGQTTA